MDSKIAGVFSLIAPAALLGIWCVFLFASRPDAISTSKYALTPSDSGALFFVYILISLVICLFTSGILFLGENKKQAMYLAAAHSVAAASLYTWPLVATIALPLFYFGKVRNKA